MRGAQTSGELRINCERLHRFPDIPAVEQVLAELAGHSSGPLVVKLPRQAGTRETRWAHLLSGPPVAAPEDGSADATAPEAPGMAVSELATMKANLARLQNEVAALRSVLLKVCAELGIRSEELS